MNTNRRSNVFLPDRKPILVVENFQLSRSNIHGIGLFAKHAYPNGRELGVAFVIDELSYLYEGYLGDNYDKNANTDYIQLSAVRYVNHSLTPNIELYKPEKDRIYARCLKDIEVGDEITANYNLAFPLFGEGVPTWVNK